MLKRSLCLLVLTACEPMGTSWELMAPLDDAQAAVSDVASGTEDATEEVDDRFPTEEEMARQDDPLGTNEVAEEVPASGEAPAAAEQGEEDPVPAEVDEETVSEEEAVSIDEAATGQTEEAAEPTGLPEGPGWGVRLVATLPAAQPPRAVLGLPSGHEVVVSPGSMVTEAGIVVIAIGRGTVELAVVSPEGDHARVEQRTLHAQYPTQGTQEP